MTDKTESFPLRVRSHILRLLGDQLVGHDRLAIFELVKNAYDADATKVKILLDIKKNIISVRDDGHGMSASEIRAKWLDIGTDSKRGTSRTRSPIFHRMPLGEKGVGRLAVQKLGNHLEMVSKASNTSEVVVKLFWNNLIESSQYVDSKLTVDITEREIPIKFLNGNTGTSIEISDLTRKIWARKDLRDLKRLVVSLESPFRKNDSFSVQLDVPGRESDINDVPDLEELLKRSVWVCDFTLNDTGFNWSYDFSPPKLKGLKRRKLCSSSSERLEWCDEAVKEAKAIAASSKDVPIFVDKKDLAEIGSISGKLHVFYRRDEILRLIGDPRQTKQWLKDQSGIRVFRDGIRVYNYGEPDDDWLGLNSRRINKPTSRFGNDQIVSAIDLDLNQSSGLKEKTNREGFNQDETYSRFRYLILSIIEHFEKIHDPDRREIDLSLRSDDAQAGSTIKLNDAISGLKKIYKNDKKLSFSMMPLVSAIEKEVEQVKSVMLNAGMAGMGLALVFHEIDRSIRTLTTLAEKGANPDRLKSGLSDLRKMLDSISVLLRQGKSRRLSIRETLQKILELNEVRFKFHEITVSCPIITGESPDFFVTAPQHLLLSAINNIIDNAIYWSEHRYKLENGVKPAILITSSWNEIDGGSLSIVDNGSGLSISGADAIQPFITKRTGGMGLGLYYCQLVMENIGGKLQVSSVIETKDLVEIEDAFNGAAITMFFSKE